MAGKNQGYKVTVTGPGHNFEREIDEAVASQVISLAMIGKVPHAGGAWMVTLKARKPRHPRNHARSIRLANYSRITVKFREAFKS